jgi:hypothetical protein
MGDFKIDQESFWAGEFGNGYIDRNISAGLLSSNRVFFARVINRPRRLESVLELGANVGMNLRALRDLLPDGDLAAVSTVGNFHWCGVCNAQQPSGNTCWSCT